MLIRAVLHRSLNYIAERSLFISRKDAKEEESDRTLEILQASALFNEPQRKERAMPSLRDAPRTAGFAYAR
ncbi:MULTISPECIES: hypothetical protein [unclassified Nostoc]|uniref:hypothetical protein n=1 Tax=unclassified Nostoc TaxID=2593658 RepID=UPI0011807231|nr:hypothetical protein [Nostoc sp. 'Peltigera membranacea cyanobiont' 232]